MNVNNFLKNEKSPYLLQHADNPVNWYPWGDKAFNKAKKEVKPVFLSIGYSTCHWCHVMARESFVDKKVASLINEVFIAVKVDREERPDIDKIYMNVCQMMTGSGGWPLTTFLTPDKEPFFAGTYIPKYSKYGRKGLIELIKTIEKLWNENRDKVINSAGEITKRLRNEENISEEIPDNKYLQTTYNDTYNDLLDNYDNENGGFGYTTKFPTPHRLLFLLRYWYRRKEDRAIEMVEETLMAIRKGGICDQLGYGFHRYAMDKEWLIPHFEKMLYDQALLLMVYTEAYQETTKEIYATICKEIFTYLKGRLYSTDGVFYSAEDAESEGEEGKYYLWEKGEIKSILTDKEMKEFKEIFYLNNINEYTHDKVNKYTLSLRDCKYINSNIYKRIKNKLLKYREKRVSPALDDKVLTDWNGLLIASLARAAWVYNNEEFLNYAKEALAFINKKLISDDGKLYHNYCKGKVSVEGNIDDYSFLIWGLIELYESSFLYKYIDIAVKLINYSREHFWDEENGGFYFSDKNKKDLIIRQKEIYDGAVPSGNSILLWNLIRLAHITGDLQYEDMAEKIVLRFTEQTGNYPSNYCQYFCALDSFIGPFKDVVIAGNRDNDNTKKMFRKLRKNYIPNKILIFIDKNKKVNKEDRFRKYQLLNDKTTAFVCKDYTCSLPTNDKEEMLKKLLDN